MEPLDGRRNSNNNNNNISAPFPWKVIWIFGKNSKKNTLSPINNSTPQAESLTMPVETRNKEFTCCFGMHVHTATILIGLWHLFLNVLALCLVAVIWRNPHIGDEFDPTFNYDVDFTAPALPTPLSKIEPPVPYNGSPYIYRRQYQNFDLGGLVCACMVAITLMFLYGAIKGKPSHLLPFFCLQILDFSITTLTAAGYLCYLQAIHRLIAESPRVPWREQLLQLSPDELVCLVLLVFVTIVLLKAYTISIVWRCYKYLHLRRQNVRTFLSSGIQTNLRLNNTSVVQLTDEPRSYATLLPNYDEAIAQYVKQAPPPSYLVAISNMNENEMSNVDNNNDTSNNNNTIHVNANVQHAVNNNDLNIEDIDNVNENEDVADTDNEETPLPSYTSMPTVTNSAVNTTNIPPDENNSRIHTTVDAQE